MGIVKDGLIDQHGRVATDLRVSLTDRCNLRCEYCMPAEGLDRLPSDETLTDEELIRLIGIGVEMLGVRDVHFTGGEPLLRRSLPKIVAETKALLPRAKSASNRSRSTRFCCAASMTAKRRSCCAGAWTTTMSSASSSRCRLMPSTTGTAKSWSLPTRRSAC